MSEVKCTVCGTSTNNDGTKLCDRCWEIKSKMEHNFDLAQTIMTQLQEERTQELVIIHQEGSNTIRQMPQNYLIAYRTELGQSDHWNMDADLAADPYIVQKVCLALLDFETKYGTGENLIKAITK